LNNGKINKSAFGCEADLHPTLCLMTFHLLTYITTSGCYEFDKSHSTRFTLDGGVRPKGDS